MEKQEPQVRGSERNRLLVNKIRDGTVIDHIPAGRALLVLKILRVGGAGENRVALVINAESRKMGRKDIVKLEGVYPDKEELDKIALAAPNATVNIIRDYIRVEKRKVTIPEVIEGILECINPTCISRQPREHIKPKFRTISTKPLIVQCIYCGSLLGEKEIERALIEK